MFVAVFVYYFQVKHLNKNNYVVRVNSMYKQQLKRLKHETRKHLEYVKQAAQCTSETTLFFPTSPN